MISPETSVSIALILTLLTLACNIITTYLNISSKTRKDNKDEMEKNVASATEFVRVELKLDELCRQQSTLARNSDKTVDILNTMQIHVTKIDQVIEDHETRISKLEDKL